MEHRAEPRFPVRSPIRVIVPGDPARILGGELIDVSGTGMRFLADEQVTPDEIVAIEVDSRLVLAEIRYCQTRGYKFVVGVKRLQEVAKDAELKDSGACATEMIRDLRRHISAAGEGDPQALAMNALEKIVERSEIHPAGSPTIADVAQAARPAEPRVISAFQVPPPTAGVTDLASADIASNPAHKGEDHTEKDLAAADIASSPAHKRGDRAEIESAEIEFQEPREAPIPETTAHSSPMRQLGASGPDDQETREILHEPAGTVPRVLQAEVIESDVIEPAIQAHPSGCAQTGDVLDGDVLDGDVLEGDDSDPPVADFLGQRVSAGIESRAPMATERVTEPVAPVAAAPVIKIPFMVRAPIRLDAATQADPHFTDLRAERATRDSAGAADAAAQADPHFTDLGAERATRDSAGTADAARADPHFTDLKAERATRDSAGAADAARADPHFTALRAERATRDSADAADASARASRSWRVPVGIAAALVLAATLTFFFVQRRTQASSLAPAIVAGTAEVAPAPVPSPAAAPPASIPSPAAVPPASVPSPAAPPINKVGVHHARIKIIEASWVTLVVDGGEPLQTMLYKGDVHDFAYSQKAFLRLGNAAGVELTLDGAPVGPLKSKLLLLEFTPKGVQFR